MELSKSSGQEEYMDVEEPFREQRIAFAGLSVSETLLLKKKLHSLGAGYDLTVGDKVGK